MWEEARGLHPSYQVPELDQSHHPKGARLLRCLPDLRAPPPEHPDQVRPHGGHGHSWEPSGCTWRSVRVLSRDNNFPEWGILDQHLHHHQAPSWVSQEMTESALNILCLLSFTPWHLLENHCSLTASTMDIGKCGISGCSTSVDVPLAILCLIRDTQGAQQNEPSTLGSS